MDEIEINRDLFANLDLTRETREPHCFLFNHVQSCLVFVNQVGTSAVFWHSLVTEIDRMTSLKQNYKSDDVWSKIHTTANLTTYKLR